ncbi:MAG: hypothetical protein KC996_10465 [Phycisphaerales bacterium]|nr:hypothetical protein [Phycisphaerales bacterium]
MGQIPTDNPEHFSSDSEIDGIARQLVGELRCIECGYDLRGLSIRSLCPECQLPVRATILSIVDPKAEQLAPLTFPRLTGTGLVMWSSGGLLAIMMVWVLRLSELSRDLLDLQWKPWWIPWLGLLGIGVSAVGASALIRPNHRVRRAIAIRAALGVGFYAPLMLIYYTIYSRIDLLSPSPLLSPGMSSLSRSVLRLMLFACIAVIIWGLRPNAVGLAIRSVVVRTGRIDRQSLYAVLLSFLVAAIGDALHLLGAVIGGGVGDVFSALQIVFVSLGSVLLTVGMINIVIDTLRLYPVLVRPGVGLSDIFETNDQKERRAKQS